MNDGIMIIDGLDQSLPYDNQSGWLFDKVDEILQESVDKRDVNIAFSACKQMIDISKLSGLGLAKFLYGIKQNWPHYMLNEDESFDSMAFDRLGLRSETVNRYYRVWAMYADTVIPEIYIEAIRQRNIKDQIPIASALAQGYEFTDKDWQEISRAPNYSGIAKKMREIKGKPPRKNSLQITLKNDGTLMALYNDEQVFVGYLNLKEESDTTAKAVERIVNNSGILKDW